MLDMLCTKINRQNLYIVIPPLTHLLDKRLYEVATYNK